MTNHADMPITGRFVDLPFAEQLALWGVRQWVRAFKEGAEAHGLVHDTLKIASATDAYPALDGLMTLLASAGDGSIDVRCPKCRQTSDDEHRLLGAVADPHLADAFLEPWMRPSALRIARQPVTRLAQALHTAGLTLRLRALGQIATRNRHPSPARPAAGLPATVH